MSEMKTLLDMKGYILKSECFSSFTLVAIVSTPLYIHISNQFISIYRVYSKLADGGKFWGCCMSRWGNLFITDDVIKTKFCLYKSLVIISLTFYKDSCFLLAPGAEKRQSPVIEHMGNMEKFLGLIQGLYELWSFVRSFLDDRETYRVGETHLGWKSCRGKKEEVIQYGVRTSRATALHCTTCLPWLESSFLCPWVYVSASLEGVSLNELSWKETESRHLNSPGNHQ